MPIYTFYCPKCQDEITDIFPMKDSSGKGIVCPKCGHKGLRQVFKGSFSMITKDSVCPTGTCSLTKNR